MYRSDQSLTSSFTSSVTTCWRVEISIAFPVVTDIDKGRSFYWRDCLWHRHFFLSWSEHGSSATAIELIGE